MNRTDLQALLHYDPDTGDFMWARSRGRCIAGEKAGHHHKAGYRIIRINGKGYMAHRLAWFYATGKMPENEIDHINGDKSDNRFCNLREATRSQNSINRPVMRNNKTGIKNVCFVVSRGKYNAQIKYSGKIKFLGYYDCPELAELVVSEYRDKYHGDFARHS